jgi:macrolide transport system ATP-binding/permease protein
LLLTLIAGISLIVGGIGVMNIMLMAVKERTREIGIRMATGARQRDIQRQFLTEAVMVSLVGGAIGVIIGLAIGAALIFWEVPVIFSVRAMLLAFGCAVVTGLVFGYMPARTAARLDPVVALGGE